MILLKKQISQNLSVAVWQITETEDGLLNSLQLCPEDKASICSIKLQKVRLQKLACRAALAELLGSNEIGISYTEKGQPIIKAFHISFSHTINTVAVALSKNPVGIDIEELTPRIVSLYPRFMSKDEIAACNLNNLKELYYFWCAKEAMYKWFADKNLDLINDLQVFKNENKGVICKKHTVQLSSFNINNKLIILCS